MTNSVLQIYPDVSSSFNTDGDAAGDWTGRLTHTSNHDKQWSENGDNILYCLSQTVDEHCKVQFSVGMMVVVIVCNVVKVVCMLWIAKQRDDMEPLTTLGDAIASFLDEPDTTTNGHCLANSKTFLTMRGWSETSTRYRPRKGCMRWYTAASPPRWILTNTICVLPLSAVLGLLFLGLHSTGLQGQTSISALWKLGFGTVSSSQTIDPNGRTSTRLVSMVLLSNCPQLLLSAIYISFNALMTCMLVGREWNKFALERKPLRVTSPRGQQCSTYYQQLPYRYAVPLLVISGLLHWLVSQSIFLAAVDVYDHYNVLQPTESISTCGYSCISIIFVLIVGSLVPIGVFVPSLHKHKEFMPPAGSCSAAIAAACHPPKYEKNASTLPIKWGDVGGRIYDYASGEKGVIRHCSFSSGEVGPPVEGELYS